MRMLPLYQTVVKKKYLWVESMRYTHYEDGCTIIEIRRPVM
ncbi:unnamed protein product [Arabidopsis halleri]